MLKIQAMDINNIVDKKIISYDLSTELLEVLGLFYFRQPCSNPSVDKVVNFSSV